MAEIYAHSALQTAECSELSIVVILDQKPSQIYYRLGKAGAGRGVV